MTTPIAQGPVDVNVSRHRPAKDPGGMECNECGCIFVGEPFHGLCAVCHAEWQAEIAAYDERHSNPPCLECGAATAEEAETKCNCGGDKDSCHGTMLWPD